MDAFSAVLDGPRARGAFLLRLVLSPPWGVRVEDEAPLTVITVVSGSACLVDEDGEPLSLTAGDVALVRGPRPYLFADSPDSQPQVRVDPEQRCWSLEDGRSLVDEMSIGVRTWGNADLTDDDADVCLVGAYDLTSQITPLLVGLLPRSAVTRGHDWTSPVRDLLVAEVGRDAAGQGVVLDRLLDLVLIEALRHWFTTRAADAPTWWLAAEHDLVGPAIRAMQTDPSRGWTVAVLAREAGMSRAAFARRFHELVGTPPMTFLTQWRLSLAADLLRDTDVTVAAVARDVGYGSPFALSAAFTRRYSASPTAYRRHARRPA
ncbi:MULTISPECIES: AraC family transcriptional regulator [unclassified Knoellia]|uniref:AraC family transcriptional regulator n=1 Tax=Knoellia altitudinis TaxID=3404795 RepID=UPI00361CD21B